MSERTQMDLLVEMPDAVTLTLDDGRVLRGALYHAGGRHKDPAEVMRAARLSRHFREIGMVTFGRPCIMVCSDGTDHAVDLGRVKLVDGVAP